jgi:hypothetical protein
MWKKHDVGTGENAFLIIQFPFNLYNVIKYKSLKGESRLIHIFLSEIM